MYTLEQADQISVVGPVIDSIVAQELGSRVSAIFWQHVDNTGFNGQIERGALQAKFSDEPMTRIRNLTSNHLLLSPSDQLIISGARQHLDALIGERSYAKKTDSADFHFGTPRDGGWHIDGSRDIRLIVNLSSVPLTMLVAKDWDDSYFVNPSMVQVKPRIKPAKDKYTEIEYKPGEAVLVDNACERADQIPHAGVNAPDKVIMRMATSVAWT
ncbi:MAG TPA: hypothetical protein VGF75_05305 [Candidatus Saccharimonadales bacterium]|jgi:hypothetical protein